MSSQVTVQTVACQPSGRSVLRRVPSCISSLPLRCHRQKTTIRTLKRVHWLPRDRHIRLRDPTRVSTTVSAALDATAAAGGGEAQLLADSTVALATLGIVSGLLIGTFGVVTYRVRETINDRNREVQLTAQLQAVQLRLVNETLDPEEAAELRREVLKLKITLEKLKQEADEGRGIRETREKTARQAAAGIEITPGMYMRKSLESIFKEGKRNSALPGASSLSSNLFGIITILIIFALAVQAGYLLQIPDDNSIPGPRP
mmetsp:Transcript_42183/g.51219  ORF Transcript_42183/g.51219 Transcript_42183/m.51219 type:complete len:259 (+) Transcript_42183:99-875(+)|eukprot:CAMPEP_0197854470 /NCGR_PEP_ID=MMETSP1438-20131217/24743_1 /TAXON_ID=1461541 /ORGANISM="Pterosperma sp., Strain CCMP1384" /LENGTH=258 /DNA_ID=CAMNT_0043469227 /DNA_START=97 /DNA_END=873 /DNA_ORIENTATION=-